MLARWLRDTSQAHSTSRETYVAGIRLGCSCNIEQISLGRTVVLASSGLWLAGDVELALVNASHRSELPKLITLS